LNSPVYPHKDQGVFPRASFIQIGDSTNGFHE
jgi:hypothetical protein